MNVYVCGLVEGLMVYWDEVEDAARYYVRLFIGETNNQTKEITYNEIAFVDVERNLKFYSFTGLSRINKRYVYCGRTPGSFTGSDYILQKTNLDYFVEVEAEDRNGNIVDKSCKCRGRILLFRDLERDF